MRVREGGMGGRGPLMRVPTSYPGIAPKSRQSVVGIRRVALMKAALVRRGVVASLCICHVSPIESITKGRFGGFGRLSML